MAKQYGLIVPGAKAKPGGSAATFIKKPSIFDEDSDDEDASASRPTGITKTLKRQDRVAQEKAVEEDPTVYQYDELYDEMDQKRRESKLSRKDLDRKPKYISKLLQAAERRKRENERRIEKQVQKEREAEGEAFKDKESFVTSPYRQKLEELKELEERERREEYLEAIGDVKKQENLDGFYRHLYDQKVNYEERMNVDEEAPEVEIKKEDAEEEAEKPQEKKDVKPAAKRSYRRHEEEDEDEEPEMKREHLPSNLDADSDFSIDDSSSDGGEDESGGRPEESEEKPAKKSEEKNDTEAVKETVDHDVKSEDKAAPKQSDIAETGEEDKDKDVKENGDEKPAKPKIDIWKKRTVGAAFDEALQRYYERKALREAGNK